MKRKFPDDEKFRELILFLAEASEGDDPFGAVKLNKLLFYVDFFAYITFGKAVTWHVYQKLENGPAPRALLPIQKKMLENGDIAFSERKYFGLLQKRVMALREPNLEVFSGPEVQLMNQAVKEFWGKSATEMSRLSHEFLGWELAEIGEDIPYQVSLVSMGDPGEKARQKGIELEAAARRICGKGP